MYTGKERRAPGAAYGAIDLAEQNKDKKEREAAAAAQKKRDTLEAGERSIKDRQGSTKTGNYRGGTLESATDFTIKKRDEDFESRRAQSGRAGSILTGGNLSGAKGMDDEDGKDDLGFSLSRRTLLGF